MTDTQLELFDLRPLTVGDTAPTIAEQFAIFHDINPHVYDNLVRMARDLVARGHQRVGVGMLFEVLRWSSMRTDSEAWKLNNNYRSHYARLIMATEDDLAGVFETRELREEARRG